MSNSLHNWINYLSKSKFLRNIVTVATGIAAAQAISLAFMPFLTRLYGPEAFGALAAFTAIIGIITPLATLGYANAIIMPKTVEGANAVARLSLISSSIISTIALIIIYAFQAHLAPILGLENQPNLLYLIPISLVLVALLSVANQVAIREGLFKAKSTSYVASTFIMNLGKLSAGYISATGTTLIIFLIISKVINYSMLMARVPKVGAFDFRQWFGTKGIKEVAFKYKDFTIYRMPQSILNAATLGLPVLLISKFFGASEAGQYSVAVAVLGAPILLLGQAVGEVFYPKITRNIESDIKAALNLVLKATISLVIISLLVFSPILFFGADLFKILFGLEWEKAGAYSSWLAIWMIGTLSSRACLASLASMELQFYLLYQEVGALILRVLGLYIGFYYFESDLIAVLLFSLVGFFVNMLLIMFVISKMRERCKN